MGLLGEDILGEGAEVLESVAEGLAEQLLTSGFLLLLFLAGTGCGLFCLGNLLILASWRRGLLAVGIFVLLFLGGAGWGLLGLRNLLILAWGHGNQYLICHSFKSISPPKHRPHILK